MKAQSRPTLVVHEPLPNKTIWSFQELKERKMVNQLEANQNQFIFNEFN